MPRRFLVPTSLIALALFVTGVYLWQRRSTPSPSKPVREEPPRVKVVIVMQPLPSGIVLARSDLRVTELPAPQVPEDALTDPEEAVGAILLYPVSEGQPLTRRVIQPPPDRLRPFQVPVGMRGFVLYQDFTEGAADIVLPGDLVDIIATRPGGERVQTELIAQRVRVLFAEDYTPETSWMRRLSAKMQRGKEGEKSATPMPRQRQVFRRLILAVTPQEAVRLTQAMEEGRIITVLRSTRDFLLTPSFRSPIEKRKAPAPPKPSPKPPSRTVIVFRGTVREEVSVSP